MTFNLKDILNPKSCEECKLLSFDEFYMPCCNLGVWSWDLVDHRDNEVGEGFDYKKLAHKDCPLPRIKCENCKHHSLWPDGTSYCNKFAYDCIVVCIEFEEAV